MTGEVFELDKIQRLETIFKREFGATSFILAFYDGSGLLHTYIPDEIIDIDLVYLIQTLADRRQARNAT